MSRWWRKNGQEKLENVSENPKGKKPWIVYAGLAVLVLVFVGAYYWWVIDINTSMGQHPFTGEPLEQVDDDVAQLTDDKSRVLQLRPHVVMFDERSYDRVTGSIPTTTSDLMQLTDKVWQHIQQSQVVTWLGCRKGSVPAEHQERWGGTWAWEIVISVDSYEFLLVAQRAANIEC